MTKLKTLKDLPKTSFGNSFHKVIDAVEIKDLKRMAFEWMHKFANYDYFCWTHCEMLKCNLTKNCNNKEAWFKKHNLDNGCYVENLDNIRPGGIIKLLFNITEADLK